jgi:hypothetical protein
MVSHWRPDSEKGEMLLCCYSSNLVTRPSGKEGRCRVRARMRTSKSLLVCESTLF